MYPTIPCLHVLLMGNQLLCSDTNRVKYFEYLDRGLMLSKENESEKKNVTSSNLRLTSQRSQSGTHAFIESEDRERNMSTALYEKTAANSSIKNTSSMDLIIFTIGP